MRLPAVSARMWVDDRTHRVLDHAPLDIPDDPLALLRIGLDRLFIDQRLDPRGRRNRRLAVGLGLEEHAGDELRLEFVGVRLQPVQRALPAIAVHL